MSEINENRDCPPPAEISMDAHEDLAEYLGKAHALIHFAAISPDFLEHPREIIHGYLWTLDDVIVKAKELCEQILDSMMKAS
jgi:hypothetical protein